MYLLCTYTNVRKYQTAGLADLGFSTAGHMRSNLPRLQRFSISFPSPLLLSTPLYNTVHL